MNGVTSTFYVWQWENAEILFYLTVLNFEGMTSNNDICRSDLHDLVIYLLLFRYSVILIFDSLIK